MDKKYLPLNLQNEAKNVSEKFNLKRILGNMLKCN